MTARPLSSEQCPETYPSRREQGQRCDLPAGHELPHVCNLGNGDQLRWHECDWVDSVEGPDVVGKHCSICGEEKDYSDD